MIAYQNRSRLAFALVVGIALAAAPTAQDHMTPNTITPKEQAEGWRLLFDGRTTAGWRGYRQPTLPDGWRVVDGALTRVGQAGDIVTTGQFGDFELTLDWKLQANGNSGLFYRVTEEDPIMWHTRRSIRSSTTPTRNRSRPAQYTGANYDLHPPSRDVTRPIGSWNETRIVVARPARRALAERCEAGRLRTVDAGLGTARSREQVQGLCDLRPRPPRPHRAAGPRRSAFDSATSRSVSCNSSALSDPDRSR